MWKNFVTQKSMTGKPFLEFSHTEAKSLDIFLCAVACLLSKASWIEFEKFTRTLPIIWWQNDINSAKKFFWAFILWFVFSKQSIWHTHSVLFCKICLISTFFYVLFMFAWIFKNILASVDQQTKTIQEIVSAFYTYFQTPKLLTLAASKSQNP